MNNPIGSSDTTVEEMAFTPSNATLVAPIRMGRESFYEGQTFLYDLVKRFGQDRN
jgi:bifunctional N-acetylglucosamine-1-phosphate-uridyltransferase/glucosamine-1-phosphate-acetyltransferase GlmU-like protein